MSAWRYVKAGFRQRAALPLLGRVPLNAVALAGFGVAGFDNPLMWAAGAGWELLWMLGTAGRHGFRKKVDSAIQQEKWRHIEERRLQLYHQLSPTDQYRHHQLRQACVSLLDPALQKPDPAAELLIWLHLKLLLAGRRTETETAPNSRPAQATRDPDLPRLQAALSVELTDPSLGRMADDAVALLDARQGLADPLEPMGAAINRMLQRIENQLLALQQIRHPGKIPAATYLSTAGAPRQACEGHVTPGPQTMPVTVDPSISSSAQDSS